MSDNWLILIPKSPDYVPTKMAQDQAVALFKAIAPDSDEVKVEVSEYPRLIDCGTNLEKIICPSCHRKLDTNWWVNLVSEEAESNFRLGPMQLPCCGSFQSLANLIYDLPQGFARFSIEAMNPKIRDLPPGADHDFEKILGCDLIKIWQHL